ncbi:MAG: glycosyl transferase family 1, partial [bacterium]
MARLDDYIPVAGRHVIEDLWRVADRLKGRSVVHVNSTAVGGGVAEILSRMIPLLKDLGLDCRWEVMRGGEDFFTVTKKIHNALHGSTADISPRELQTYRETAEANLASLNLDADFVFIHDPQPAALIKARRGDSKWIWRCHIDLSNPAAEVWAFLEDYVRQYDASVFSSPGFARKMDIPQVLIPPSIDPLSEKNREMEPSEIAQIMDRLC